MGWKEIVPSIRFERRFLGELDGGTEIEANLTLRLRVVLSKRESAKAARLEAAMLTYFRDFLYGEVQHLLEARRFQLPREWQSRIGEFFGELSKIMGYEGGVFSDAPTATMYWRTAMEAFVDLMRSLPEDELKRELARRERPHGRGDNGGDGGADSGL